MMNKYFFFMIIGSIFLSILAFGADNKLCSSGFHRISSGASENFFGEDSVDISIDSNLAIVGVKSKGNAAGNPGEAFIVSYNGSSWAEEAELAPADGKNGDLFGKSVAIYGRMAVIGAPLKDCSAGKDCGGAYLYRKNIFGRWVEEAKLKASDAKKGAQFGIDVATSENFVVVGAQRNKERGDSTGAVYVYHKKYFSWIEEKLTASDGAEDDTFGNRVAISGNVIMVGAAWKNSEAGVVYIFSRTGSAWIEQKLAVADIAVGDHFGKDIAISGDLAAVGSPLHDSKGIGSGAVYLFKFDGHSWVETAKVTPSAASDINEFGNYVAISGEYLLVGAKENGIGLAYLFQRKENSWVEKKIFRRPAFYKEAFFASPVAIFLNEIMLGAPDKYSTAYIYCD